MKIEKYYSGKWKRIVIGGIVFVVIVAAIIINTSLAKYKNTESIPLVRGTISYSFADLNVVAMYQENDNGEYEEIQIMPSSGYAINEDKSYCYTTASSEKDTSAKLYTNSNGEHVIANLSKKSKCYLYFDEFIVSASKILLANKAIIERTDFSAVLTEETTGILYTAEDDDGTSYYYAGAATDNYVSFAGFYWRIIRINGDGSIRLIYDGTTAKANGTSSDTTQIGTSAYNSAYDDNMYVGYMYTSGEVHGLGISSTIKETLDNWFTSNLSDYTSYIDYNAGFCGDRTAYTDTSGTTSGGGTGSTKTYYGAFIRLRTNNAPDLKCAESSDLYTTSSSSKGNKALTYPIGLITADEVAYAGGAYNTNNYYYYLYTGQHYWTMSPYSGNNGLAGVLYVKSTGHLYDTYAYNVFGIRPVINLKADTLFTGYGSRYSSYIIS